MKKRIPLLIGFVIVLSVLLTSFLMNGCKEQANRETNAQVTSEQVTETSSSIDENISVYKDVIASLPSGSAYAFADMAEDQDALLVTEAPMSFEGSLEAAKATVYAKDKDGKVVKMGTVESTTTSMPLMAYEHAVYFGSHHSMSKATINTKESKMDVETAESSADGKDSANKAYDELFQDYTKGTIINFTAVD